MRLSRRPHGTQYLKALPGTASGIHIKLSVILTCTNISLKSHKHQNVQVTTTNTDPIEAKAAIGRRGWSLSPSNHSDQKLQTYKQLHRGNGKQSWRSTNIRQSMAHKCEQRCTSPILLSTIKICLTNCSKGDKLAYSTLQCGSTYTNTGVFPTNNNQNIFCC